MWNIYEALDQPAIPVKAPTPVKTPNSTDQWDIAASLTAEPEVRSEPWDGPLDNSVFQTMQLNLRIKKVGTDKPTVKALDSSGLNCVAAYAERERLNSEAGHVLPGRGKRLREYFDLKIESYDDGSCLLVLDPKIIPDHWKFSADEKEAAFQHGRITADQRREEIAVIDKIRDEIEDLASSDEHDVPIGSGSRSHVYAFSYALGPRLQRAYSLRLSRGDTIGGSAGGGSMALDTKQSLTTQVADSQIIGFTPPNAMNEKATTARFGWAIGPERNGPSPWERHLSIQQAELSALVAVPSWWRSVVLKTCTRFVREPDLARLTLSDETSEHDRNPNPGSRHCKVDIIRLPGTAADLSSRLGVEVVKFPFLKSPATQNSGLIAGRAGKLLLEGGRLWRSAVVMLGSQKADQIEVLPDMQGLIAKFNCVENPTLWDDNPRASSPDAYDVSLGGKSTPAQGTDQYSPFPLATAPKPVMVQAPIRVWTSEGSTPAGGEYIPITIPGDQAGQPRCEKERPDAILRAKKESTLVREND